MSKKILTAILTTALIASLASCGSSKEETTTTTTTTAATTTTADTTVADTDVEDVVEEETEATEGNAAEEETDDTATAGGAQAYADIIINSGVEFPAIGLVEDEAILTDVLSYDLSLFSDYSVTMHMMSAHLIEVTVAKPAEGKEDAALEFVNNRMNQLKTEVAFYPEQQETADQTVVGSFTNAAGENYVYLICCNDAAKAEEALLAAVN